MPNFAVFNLDPNQLQTLIFGTDGTNIIPISTDSSGRLNIGEVTTITAVEATTIVGGTLSAVEAATIVGGTLNAVEAATIVGGTLSAVEAATIIGGTIDALLAGTVSATILGGTITSISENNFNQFTLPGVVVSSTSFTPIPAASLEQNTSPYKVYSYVVYNNTGAVTVDAVIQLSSDATRWIVDSTVTGITTPGYVLTPFRFAKYTRLALSSPSGGSANVDVYLDAQV